MMRWTSEVRHTVSLETVILFLSILISSNLILSVATTWQPSGNHLAPQVRLGKVSIGKDSIGEGSIGKVYNINYDEIVKAYNEFCADLPTVRILTDDIKEKINECMQMYTAAEICEAFKRAGESDFLKGKNKIGWSASFGWIFQGDNIAKILNGNYDNEIKKADKQTDLDDLF